MTLKVPLEVALEELEAAHRAGGIMAERVRDQDAEIERLRKALVSISIFDSAEGRFAIDTLRGHQQLEDK